MTDFRALCEKLLDALENEGHAHWPGGPDGDPLIEQARAVLARWGNHQGMLTSSMPQPIPVTERLPGLEDCDAEGRYWWGAPAYPDLAPASWRFVSTKDRFSSELYWLPANALPQPS